MQLSEDDYETRNLYMNPRLQTALHGQPRHLLMQLYSASLCSKGAGAKSGATGLVTIPKP